MKMIEDLLWNCSSVKVISSACLLSGESDIHDHTVIIFNLGLVSIVEWIVQSHCSGWHLK